MSRRRPWRVHVHSIGPNFSYATEERARAQAERLVSGETWDGGVKGLLGSYSTVTVYGPILDGPVLLRRSVFSHDGTTTEEEFPRTCSGWRVVKTCAACDECGVEITKEVEAHVTVWLDGDGDALSYVPELHDHSPRGGKTT